MPVFAGGELNGWMIVGFVLATGAVIGNDSPQTLGTYIFSNHQTTPKGWQMLFLCVLTAVVLLLGWFLNNGTQPGVWWCPVDRFPCRTPSPGFTFCLPWWRCCDLVGAPLSTSFWCCARFSRPGRRPAGVVVGRPWHRLSLGLLVYGWVCGCWNAGCVSDRAWG